MPDFGAQAGQSYAKHAVHEPHSESGPMSKDAHLDEIFKQIKAGPLSTLAGFLYFLFAMSQKKDYSRTALELPTPQQSLTF
jgi:hypothetical protein